MAKKPPASATPTNVNDILTKEIQDNKLTNLVKLCDEMSDMSVVCIPTGLPQLDVTLHAHKKGFPAGRDIEFFSKKPESGKTSLAMQILSSFQHQGMRGAAADVERTMTDELFAIHKIVTDPFYDPSIYALRMMRNEDTNIAAEKFLEGIKTLSGMFDILVVDSVAALETKANLDKDVDDAKGVGGCSKLLSEFMRGNLAKRASVLWINQTRSKIGATMPGMGEQFVRPGGKALDFYASIILELTMIQKLKLSDDAPPYGMKVKAFTEKNKISPQWRSCELTYLFGKGFSSEFDYFDLASKAGIITKSGSWLYWKDQKVQGMLKFVELLERNPLMFADLKTMVDGENVATSLVDDFSRNPSTSTEAEQDVLAGMLSDPQLNPPPPQFSV
jgi:recombination protein RecA